MVFDTTLPLAAVGAVGGPEAAQIVRPLESTVAPTIHFEQRTGGLANPQPHVTATYVHAEFSSPLRAYHVPLDRAVVEARAYKGFTDIPHFEFGLAGGQAEGNATITVTSNGMDELRFSLLLQNARHTDFLSALGQFHAGDASPAPAPTNTLTNNATPTAKTGGSMLGDPNKPGLLDLALGGRLLLGDPDSFAAAGQARVRNAQLGQLQLLGALSRTLSDIKVPFGEFSLNAASSDLQIAHQYMRLPNLVVTGPSARIVSAGIYNLAEGDLNFNALIFPVGEWDSFLLKQIASILNPFSNTVTLKLHGKYEKPEWNVSMNPLRLFEDRTVEGPTIPGYPAKANGAPALPELPPAPVLPELPVEKK
jgi:hypothetical protein